MAAFPPNLLLQSDALVLKVSQSIFIDIEFSNVKSSWPIFILKYMHVMIHVCEKT